MRPRHAIILAAGMGTRLRPIGHHGPKGALVLHQRSIVEDQLDPDARHRLLWSIVKSVTASSWTTAAGFVGLLFISHKGLQTIGQLGSVGIMLSWLAVVAILPLLLLALETLWRKGLTKPNRSGG